MAYVHSNRTVALPDFGWVRETYDGFVEGLRSHSAYLKTMRELEALSKQQLDDLGIRPDDIPRIAAERALFG